MTNKGIAPPQYDTPVGEVRANVGDVEWKPLDPDQPGFGDYEMFSDDEILAFLAQANGDTALATSFAYSRLVQAWNTTAITVRQDDMQYSNKDSVGTWLNMAKFWLEVSKQTQAEAGNDYGDVIQPRRHGHTMEYAPYLGDCSAPGYGGI